MYFFRLTSAVCLGAVLLWPFHSCTCPLHLWDHQESTRRCSTFGPEIHLNWVGNLNLNLFSCGIMRSSFFLPWVSLRCLYWRKKAAVRCREWWRECRQPRGTDRLLPCWRRTRVSLPFGLQHGTFASRLWAHARPPESFQLLFCYSALRELLLFETHLHKKKRK